MRNRKKNADINISALQYRIKNKIYFLSSATWIANFGVEPLLRSITFLFRPCFLLVAFLFVSVLMVSEPICNLLSAIIFCYISLIFLQGLKLNVKSFSKIILTMFILCNAVGGLAQDISGQENDLIISIGEQREITIGNFDKFSVGNREIISYTHIEKSQKFLIKGKKIGFSDLIFWKKVGKNNNKEKIEYRIYVISKSAQLKMAKIAELLKSAGLDIKISGTLIVASGTIITHSQYRLIKKLENDHKDKILLNCTLAKELRNKIIGLVYEKFFRETNSGISCYSEYSSIICDHDPLEPTTETLVKDLKERYYINFIPSSSKLNNKNFLAKLKIIQMEKLDGTELSFGLNKLYGSVDEVFTNGVQSLIKNNYIFLESSNINISTLAEPETVLQVNSPATIEMGSNIPFQSVSNNNLPNTSWKFAGLKVELNIKTNGNEITIEYETEITKPNDDLISGNKEKSAATVELGKPIKLFQICFQTNGDKKSGLPVISKIPVLGNLFASKSTQNNYKKITGFIVIEKLEN